MREALLSSVEALARVRPYMPPALRIPADHYPAFHSGYYAAVCAALRAMQATIDRRVEREARELAAARRVCRRYWIFVLERPHLRLVTLKRKGAA